MAQAALPLLDSFSALADPTRCRMLWLLDGHELTVSELCAVLQLPQSTVSRHLKVLVDEGWANARSEGASRLYRMRRLDASASRIWETVREEVSRTPAGEQDRQRLTAVLEVRREKSAAFFSSAAGDWDKVRAELFGSNAELLPLLGLWDGDWVVGDLGCGTGQIARTVAPFVRRVVGVDSSKAMLEAARSRAVANVDYRAGTVEALPLGDAELDVALLFLVLHYVVDPALALREAARVLKPNGRLLIVDMMPHDQEELREEMGHVWSGFSAEQLDGWLNATGFARSQHIPLPVDPRAKGPALVATRATKPNGVSE